MPLDMDGRANQRLACWWIDTWWQRSECLDYCPVITGATPKVSDSSSISRSAGFKLDLSASTRRARSGLSVISPSTPIPIIRDIVTASLMVHT